MSLHPRTFSMPTIAPAAVIMTARPADAVAFRMPSFSRLVPRLITLPVVAAQAPALVIADCNHVAVPDFLTPPTAAIVAPVKPQVLPVWPCPNVVRQFVFAGGAKFRLTYTDSGREDEYAVMRKPRENGETDYYVFVKRPDAYEGKDCAYLGAIFGRDLLFRITKATAPEDFVDAKKFGRWYDLLMQCQPTPGVEVSCKASRSAARQAATAAKNAAKSLAKLSASIATASRKLAGLRAPSSEATLAIHAALRVVASKDEDKARLKNNAGFSKSDSYHGNCLAFLTELSAAEVLVGRELVRRYRGQLSAALVAAALDEVAS